MEDVAILILSLGIILIGAEGFTNGVEWLGQRLNLGAGAVGSILAAVGTALPETMVPVIAFLGGGGEQKAEVGIGAILGAPFMLSTLAFFIAGLSVLIFRRHNRPLLLDRSVLQRDLSFFLIVYSVAILASFLPNHFLKILAALALVIFYAVYVFRTLRESKGGGEEHENLPPLYLARRSHHPAMGVILGQIGLALLAIVAGAHGFVGAVQEVAVVTGIPAFVLSLIITPIATELPEKFNSVLWLRRGKDTLALGNITGAMVFQSSVIPALGLLFTPWVLDSLALLSAVLALSAALMPYLALRRKGVIFPAYLLIGGGFYLVFLVSAVRFQIY